MKYEIWNMEYVWSNEYFDKFFDECFDRFYLCIILLYLIAPHLISSTLFTPLLFDSILLYSLPFHQLLSSSIHNGPPRICETLFQISLLVLCFLTLISYLLNHTFIYLIDHSLHIALLQYTISIYTISIYTISIYTISI